MKGLGFIVLTFFRMGDKLLKFLHQDGNWAFRQLSYVGLLHRDKGLGFRVFKFFRMVGQLLNFLQQQRRPGQLSHVGLLHKALKVGIGEREELETRRICG